MTAESIPSQARTAIAAFFGGCVFTAVAGMCVWAALNSKSFEPETTALTSQQVPEGKTASTNQTTRAYVASQTAAGSAIGTPGCNDTAFVVLYKQGVVWSHRKMSLTDGFELDAGPGKKWHVKLVKP